MADGVDRYHVMMKMLEIIEQDVVASEKKPSIEELEKMASIADRFARTVVVQNVQPGGIVEMSDKFENITNSTIVNRSAVENAFGLLKSQGNEEAANAIEEVAKIVEASGNSAAAKLFDALNEELTKEAPDKSILKQCWDGVVAILPDVGKIAGAAAAIAKLLP